MAEHAPGVYVHRQWAGFIVDLEPMTFQGFTTAAMVHYPSLFSQIVRVSPQGMFRLQGHELPDGALDEIIEAALTAWGTAPQPYTWTEDP